MAFFLLLPLLLSSKYTSEDNQDKVSFFRSENKYFVIVLAWMEIKTKATAATEEEEEKKKWSEMKCKAVKISRNLSFLI